MEPMYEVRRRTIDEARARELAVKAQCDPRTIRKILRGETVRGMVAQRALEALLAAGFVAVRNEAA